MRYRMLKTALTLIVNSPLIYAGNIEAKQDSWQFSFGPRYWYSSNNYTINLYAPDKSLSSKLTYQNQMGSFAEGFWELAHQSGLYLKGYFGGGSIFNGTMNDEDFPPLITPYSNTLQQQQNGAMTYFTADLGYNLLQTSNWNFGLFLGYNYWTEQLKTYGCLQVADNQALCGNIPPSTIPIPNKINGLNNTAHWNSLRIGANTNLKINKQFTLTLDAAFLNSSLDAHDFHNFRPDIRGIKETGSGHGVQFDALLNWMVTTKWSLGLGARLWEITTDGFSHFEETFSGGQPNPWHTNQRSYGLLVQSAYQFETNKSESIDSSENFNWQGAYGGINIGYGANPQNIDVSPTSDLARNLVSIDSSPASLQVQDEGFLGGGQIGYNWLLTNIVLGIEGDIDYARLNGSNAITPNGFTTSIESNLNWLATTRARLGKLANQNTLVFLSAGAAFGQTQISFMQRIPNQTCLNNSCSEGLSAHTQIGWTAGTGVEYSVSQHATFKGEYLYVDLGRYGLNTISDPSKSVTYFVSRPYNYNIIRLGLNYKI